MGGIAWMRRDPGGFAALNKGHQACPKPPHSDASLGSAVRQGLHPQKWAASHGREVGRYMKIAHFFDLLCVHRLSCSTLLPLASFYHSLTTYLEQIMKDVVLWGEGAPPEPR